jgi:hypothetical protein
MVAAFFARSCSADSVPPRVGGAPLWFCPHRTFRARFHAGWMAFGRSEYPQPIRHIRSLRAPRDGGSVQMGCGPTGIKFGRPAKVLDRVLLAMIPVGDNSEFAVMGPRRDPDQRQEQKPKSPEPSRTGFPRSLTSLCPSRWQEQVAICCGCQNPNQVRWCPSSPGNGPSGLGRAAEMQG